MGTDVDQEPPYALERIMAWHINEELCSQEGLSEE